jgi:protocatechuate 3,4-dioxygenase beta subunit
MPARRLLALRLAPFALILALAACDERTPSTPPPGATPSALRVSGGDGQTGTVGAALPAELAVEVVDAAGRAMAGMPVRFVVMAGGGRVEAETVTSDGAGLARTRWTLGTVAADSQVVEARAEQLVPVRLRASVRADAPAAIAVVAGGVRAGPVGAVLADSLAVTVKDRYGNPVAGAEMAWEVTAGGGSLSPARSMTGADGTARSQWTLGPRVDSMQSVTARVAGLGYVGFLANAVTAGAPLVLAKRGGDGQRGTAGGVLADSLGVLLRMPDGRPVAGALVSWSVPPAAGVIAPVATRTDAEGRASAAWRLGSTPGLTQATARVDSGTLLFTALTEADAPAAAAAVSGGGAGGVGRALADSLAVRVTDRHGNPVPGAAVDWSAQTGGGAVLPARSVTGADGIARAQWTLGPAAGGQSARGMVAGLPPVAFSATAGTAGVPLVLAKRGGDGQRGPVGSLLADSLGVTLRLPDGRGVSGAVVRWSVPAGAGTVAPAESRTDANGAASAAWRVGTATGLAQATAMVDGGTLTFTALVEAEAAARIAVAGGDGGTGGVGGALADSLAVRVADRHGNPVPGAAVDWSVTAGGGAVLPARSVTGVDGIARTRWTLGPAVGGQAARAAAAGLDPVAFSATAGTAGVTLALAKRGGDGQRGPVGSLLADSLGVTLRLPDGRGVSGALVRWSVPAGAGTVAPAESRTDALGRAAAAWRLGTEAGVVQATAAVDGGTLVFTALAESGAPAQVAVAGGDGLTGPVGGPLGDSLAARVTDANGNPVAGVAVDWTPLSGNGTLYPEQSTTDAAGIARTAWTLGPNVGAVHTAQAAVAGLTPATFSATATTAGVTLLLGKRGGDGQRGPAGNLLADSLGVVLRLADGRGVAGARVVWSAASGAVTPGETRTDARGRTAAVWRLGPEFGLVQAAATVDQGTLSFTALSEGAVPTRVEVVAGDGATGPVGGALADSLAVRVSNESGALGGIEVDWTALAGGGAIHPARGMTDARGIARARWTLGPAAGNVHRAQAAVAGLPPAAFSATGATAGVPLQLARRGGDGQRGPVGVVLADSLGVTLRLADGRGVSGALVVWSAASGTVTPAQGRTDAQGRAAAVWRLGTALGPTQATASVDEGTLTFTALAEPDAPAAVRVVAGSGGTGGVGQPLADSLAVRVVDRGEVPVPGVTVTWSVVSGGGGVSPAQATTDAQGIARARWTLGLVADSVQAVRAAVARVAPAAFSATARTQGVALELVRRAGDGQSGPVGAVLADSLVAEVRTAGGSPVRNALVAWAATAGGGSVSPAVSRTDALGRARTAWRLGGTPGPAGAAATLDGGTLAFSATQTASTRVLTVLSGDGYTGTRGTMVDEVSVRLTDLAGVPVRGAEVEFVVLGGGGSVPSPSRTATDVNGIAHAQWILGVQPGQNRLGVRAAGVPEAVLTATGVDAPLRLVLVSGDAVIKPIPFHTSYGVMEFMVVQVVDPQDRPVWGVSVQFQPNNGETGARVPTGDPDAEASFFWEGWMREGDQTLPELRISFGTQVLDLQAQWGDQRPPEEP